MPCIGRGGSGLSLVYINIIPCIGGGGGGLSLAYIADRKLLQSIDCLFITFDKLAHWLSLLYICIVLDVKLDSNFVRLIHSTVTN